MNNDLISVVLPVYNAGEYLQECIGSLLKQSYDNFEAIFINDGSTDNSLEILTEWQRKDSRIKVIDQENSGVSSARNKGISLAKGVYITFIDPDDYVTCEYLEYLYKIVSNRKADIAISKGILDNYNATNNNCHDNIIVVNGREAQKQILTYRMNVAVWNKIYKRQFLQDNDILFYEDVYMGEGFNFNIKAFKFANKIVIGEKKIYFYRRDNNQSATTKFRLDKWQNALYAIDKMRININLEDDDLKQAYLFAKWRTNLDAFAILSLSNKRKQYIDFYKETLNYCKKNWRDAIRIKTSKTDKLRIIMIKIWPGGLPVLMRIRRRLCGVKIVN